MIIRSLRERLAALLAPLAHLRNRKDFEDEVNAHIELQTEENLEAGMSAGEAGRRAHLRVGRPQNIIDACRDPEWLTGMETWYRDLATGLRSIRKAPVYSLIAVFTLAIGIGANTAVFSLLYGLLLRSLPVPQPDRLVRLEVTGPNMKAASSFLGYSMFREIQQSVRSFSDVSGWSESNFTVRDAEGILRMVSGNFCTGRAFQTLGLKPYLGRFFTAADDRPGRPAAGWPLVISHSFWSNRFASDPHVIGRRIDFQNTYGIVIGVSPPGFTGVFAGWDARVFAPMQLFGSMAGGDLLNMPKSPINCAILAHLRNGVSQQEARAEIAVRSPQVMMAMFDLRRHDPVYDRAAIRAHPGRTGIQTMFGQYTTPLFLMQGLVASVLLLCCANVAGLMMSKIYSRRQEFAIRAAIGGSRWRLMRQHLTESLLLALAGAVLGAAAAWCLAPLLPQFFRDPTMFEGMSIQPDRTVFLVTGLLAIAVTLLSGSLPAFRIGTVDPGSLLRSRDSLGQRNSVAGRAFIPAQIALSVVLVAVAALLSESLLHLRQTHLGFDAPHVTIQSPPFHFLNLKGEARLQVYSRMVDRLYQSPGIHAAAVTWYTPLSGSQPAAQFRAIGSSANASPQRAVAFNFVGPAYFRAMGTNLLSGREFSANDRELNVCVLNEAAALVLFPRESSLDRYVASAGFKKEDRVSKEYADFFQIAGCRVIGVAENAKFASVQEGAPPTLYLPITPKALDVLGNLVFLINAERKKDAIDAYIAALKELAPSIPLVLFVTMKEQLDAALGSQILITALSRFFALLALFLSALGLYGLLSASVSQRRSEIGLRVALGANPRSVIRMFLSEAFRLLLVGFAAGALLLALAIPLIRDMLFGIPKFDVVVIVGTVGTLAAAGLFAAWLPARRATRIDPGEALRLS